MCAETRHVVADADRLWVRHRQRERLRRLRHGLQALPFYRPPAPERAPAPPAAIGPARPASRSSMRTGRSRGTGRSRPRTSPASPGAPAPRRAPSPPWRRSRCRSPAPASARGPAPGSRQPVRGLFRKTRLTRAMACISPWPRIGLSTYIACRLGASNSVSHMSRTSTMRSGCGFRRKPITDSGRSRSPIPVETDHLQSGLRTRGQPRRRGILTCPVSSDH